GGVTADERRRRPSRIAPTRGDGTDDRERREGFGKRQIHRYPHNVNEAIRLRVKESRHRAMQCFRPPFKDSPGFSQRCKRARSLSRRIAPVQPALSVRGLNKTYHSGQKARSVTVPALRDMCLHTHATRRVSSLSPSLLQRLGLAQSLIGGPRAILLDETLSGEGLLFDPEIVSLLTRLTGRGITIILAAPNPVELHRI